jgi:hypothetical protein
MRAALENHRFAGLFGNAHLLFMLGKNCSWPQGAWPEPIACPLCLRFVRLPSNRATSCAIDGPSAFAMSMPKSLALAGSSAELRKTEIASFGKSSGCHIITPTSAIRATADVVCTKRERVQIDGGLG